MALKTRQIVHVLSVLGLAAACSSDDSSPGNMSNSGSPAGGAATAGATTGGSAGSIATAGGGGVPAAGANAGGVAGASTTGGLATAGGAAAGSSSGGAGAGGGGSGGTAGAAAGSSGGGAMRPPAMVAVKDVDVATAELTGAEWWQLDDADALNAVVALATAARRIDAARTRLLAGIDARGSFTTIGAASTAAWLRTTTQAHHGRANVEVKLANALCRFREMATQVG